MRLENCERQTVYDVVKHYPCLIDEELLRIGENKVLCCDKNKVWNHIEEKLRDGDGNNRYLTYMPVSNIVVYSKSLEKILDVYGNLDSFWEMVLSETRTTLALLVLHMYENIPHIHLLLKFENIVSLENVAYSLGEYYLNPDGEEEARTDTLDYVYQNLFDSYCCMLHCDNLHGKEAVSYIVKITPALADYLIRYENAMVNFQYKEYLKNKEKKNEK